MVCNYYFHDLFLVSLVWVLLLWYSMRSIYLTICVTIIRSFIYFYFFVLMLMLMLMLIILMMDGWWLLWWWLSPTVVRHIPTPSLSSLWKISVWWVQSNSTSTPVAVGIQRQPAHLPWLRTRMLRYVVCSTVMWCVVWWVLSLLHTRVL